ncbi:hypothetical protein EXIGLDRAFT_746476, partial [Exidia glandulosa HHB12029]
MGAPEEDQQPPTYAASRAEPPPYPRLLPATFRVGFRETTPFVTVDELEDHLRILGAFSRLKSRVELDGQQPHLAHPLEPAAAWTVFLCRAVYRFTRWLQAVKVTPDESSLPPLDVLMVWHAYMLNPLTYKDDADRVLPQLDGLGNFPLRIVAKLIDPSTFNYAVSSEAREFFESIANEPFDPPITTNSEDRAALRCPCCDNKAEYAWPWVDDKGTGYAQRDFRAKCPYCEEKFTHEAYGVRKFCDEVITWRDVQSDTGSSKISFFLAGMTHRQMISQAPTLQKRMLQHVSADATGASFAKDLNWDMAKLHDWCMEGFKPQTTLPPRVAAILRRYTFPGPFSVELTGAVMRQASFIQKMVGMHWTQAQRFKDDPSPLVRSIARYHAFMDMMWSNPLSFFVPTLDIDLAWHTHQLKPLAYRTDTQKFVNIVPDHDDKVEENTLSNAFDITAQAWRRRFGVPYSLCGCSPDTESRASRTIRKVGSVFSASRPASAPPTNKRPDLISTEEDLDSGLPTHPSEHNAVVTDAERAHKLRKKREEKHSQMLAKRAKAVEAGNADAWTALQERRTKKKPDDGSEAAHNAAFMYPVPYWGVTYPYGAYGYGGAACGAYGGAAAAGGAGGYIASSCGVGGGGAFCGSGGGGGF